MLADVIFDAPVPHPFSYGVPGEMSVVPGQRVVAPLRGAGRLGMVIAVRDGEDARLKPLLRVAEPAPILDADRLELVRWIAAESLSSAGSTCAALLPPPSEADAAERGRWPREPGARPRPVEILAGAGRERRLLDRIATSGVPALVITADVEGAGRWAQRLAKIGPTVRLDSGATDAERAAGWAQLGAGAVTLGVGTRSALLAPLPAGATLALVDEHETAHRPPGHPRIHSREIVLARAARSGLAAVLTSATPSAEMWWRAGRGDATLSKPEPGPWPAVTLADTRGILRREPLTPPLARALRETLGAGRRVLLIVSRLSSTLACDECGAIARCERCLIALAYSRAGRTLTCRVCGAAADVMETCPACRGRRLSPFGWGAERVEHAVRRRFPQARVVRYDPEAAGRTRSDAQRAAAAAGDVVVGTRGALKLFGPGSLGLVGFVSPDHTLRLPDFRAGERLFALQWAAAERVRAGGALVIQSQTPAYYVFEAVARQSLASFYERELSFRQEAGYPPFRRLAVVTVTAGDAAGTRRLADDVFGALRGAGSLTVYPPAADRRQRRWRIIVKGAADLPRALSAALGDLQAPGPRRHGMIEVEVDPVEWPF